MKLFPVNKLIFKLLFFCTWMILFFLLAFSGYGFLASYEEQGITRFKVFYFLLFCLLAYYLQKIPENPKLKFISRIVIVLFLILIIEHRVYQARIWNVSVFF